MKYKLWANSGNVEVCQKMLLFVLGLSQRRVQNIAKNMRSGTGVIENRGEDHRSKKNVEKNRKL